MHKIKLFYFSYNHNVNFVDRTLERPMGHICPMFFSCIYSINITKIFFLTLGSFAHITEKNMQFILSLSRIWQFYSINFRICGIVELWGISTKLRYLLKVSSD